MKLSRVSIIIINFMYSSHFTVPSDSPRNISISALSSTELTVQWGNIDALHENGIITMYEIRYTPLSTFNDRIETMSVNTTGNGPVILAGLEEFVEYNISVRGYTRVGPGPYSDGVVTVTMEDGKALEICMQYNLTPT